MSLPLALLKHHDEGFHYIETTSDKYESVRTSILNHYGQAPHHLTLCLSYTTPSLILHQEFPRIAFIDGISQAAAGRDFSYSGAIMLRHPQHTSDAILAVWEYLRSADAPYTHVLIDGLHIASLYMKDHMFLSFFHSMASNIRKFHASASFLTLAHELSPEVSRHIAHLCDSAHAIARSERYPWHK